MVQLVPANCFRFFVDFPIDLFSFERRRHTLICSRAQRASPRVEHRRHNEAQLPASYPRRERTRVLRYVPRGTSTCFVGKRAIKNSPRHTIVNRQHSEVKGPVGKYDPYPTVDAETAFCLFGLALRFCSRFRARAKRR